MSISQQKKPNRHTLNKSFTLLPPPQRVSNTFTQSFTRPNGRPFVLSLFSLVLRVLLYSTFLLDNYFSTIVSASYILT